MSAKRLEQVSRQKDAELAQAQIEALEQRTRDAESRRASLEESLAALAARSDACRAEIEAIRKAKTDSRAEIEEFIQAHMTGDIMDAGAMKDMTDEDFEKLILAYDYSTRRNSKYAALNEEDRMVENGRYRYPDLKFIQRRP